MKIMIAIYALFFTLTVCADEWGESTQDAYMQGCMDKSGGAYTECRCTLNVLMKKYEAKDLGKVTVEEIQNIVKDCTEGEQ